MKPIPFSSFVGYRRFSSYWWNDLADHLIGISYNPYFSEIGGSPIRFNAPGWYSDLAAYWHRARYGWAPRDVWSLDDYFNRVMGETLLHLAETNHGSPAGYPLGKDAPMDEHGPVTDHDQWQADLRRWGQAFIDLHKWDDVEHQMYEANVDWKTIHEKERERFAAVETALREMAPWWGGLWN